MISRKILSIIILFAFCIGLLGAITLWVGAASTPAHQAGLVSPGTGLPPGKEILPCVGWNAYNWESPLDPDTSYAGRDSYSWAPPTGKEPVVQPAVGWNS